MLSHCSEFEPRTAEWKAHTCYGGLLHIISSLIDHINFFLNKNGPSQASFSFIFVFANKQYNSYHCEKSPSNIQCWDSNPRPWEHQSPPITTRPEFNPPPSELLKTLLAVSQQISGHQPPINLQLETIGGCRITVKSRLPWISILWNYCRRYRPSIQCDQIARLFLIMWTFTKKDNCPNSKSFLPKQIQNFVRYYINRQPQEKVIFSGTFD